MNLCAGGCGKPALPGGKYHCRKGEPGYAACKQKAHRQRKSPEKEGVTRVTLPAPDPRIDQLAAQMEQQQEVLLGIREAVTATKAEPAQTELQSGERPVLLAMLEEIQRMVDLQRETLDELRKQPRPVLTSTSAPSMSSLPSSETPDDMPELEISEAKRDDVKPHFNLIIKAAKLQDRYDNLPPEVIEYGVRRGLLAEDMLPKPAGGPKLMKGAELEFAPPELDFEDMEIEL